MYNVNPVRNKLPKTTATLSVWISNGVELEKKIWAGREGKIDVFVKKGNFSVRTEVDYSQIRKKLYE